MHEVNLFVYGSLSEGMLHYQRIAEFVRSKSDARIVGRAYRLKAGHPVIVDDAKDWVPGQLLTLANQPLLMALLDEFHCVSADEPAKGLFIRREAEVWTPEGREKAWVYFANPKKMSQGAREIEGGDWRLDAQREVALTEKLTERQKQYIQRLGSSTGREIVPIDLALYRELMNLEIIVDKGRRLALSKLGHEVYRYLT